MQKVVTGIYHALLADINTSFMSYTKKIFSPGTDYSDARKVEQTLSAKFTSIIKKGVCDGK